MAGAVNGAALAVAEPARADRLLQPVLYGGGLDPERPEGLGCEPFPLEDKPKQQVLGADEGMLVEPRLVLGERQYMARHGR